MRRAGVREPTGVATDHLPHRPNDEVAQGHRLRRSSRWVKPGISVAGVVPRPCGPQGALQGLAAEPPVPVAGVAHPQAEVDRHLVGCGSAPCAGRPAVGLADQLPKAAPRRSGGCPRNSLRAEGEGPGRDLRLR